jgi:hypothetical protein
MTTKIKRKNTYIVTYKLIYYIFTYILAVLILLKNFLYLFHCVDLQLKFTIIRIREGRLACIAEALE